MVFCQTGGGSPEVVKKPNCFFEKSTFQRVSRIILGPPKQVHHEGGFRLRQFFLLLEMIFTFIFISSTQSENNFAKNLGHNLHNTCKIVSFGSSFGENQASIFLLFWDV